MFLLYDFFNLSLIAQLTIEILLASLILLIISVVVLKKNPNKNWYLELLHELCRDIGIGLLVAAVVTIVYGNILDIQRFSDAISLMIGDNVPQSVWEKTKTQVLQRDVLRGNYSVTWEVKTDSSLPFDQAILKITIRYFLYGLKSQPFSYIVRQELENIHLCDKLGKYPRFDKVTVDGIGVYQGEDLRKIVKNGFLELPPIPLEKWEKTDSELELGKNKGVELIFERSEIINIPGTYSTVLSELTKNITLHIEPAEGISYELKEWFDSKSSGFKHTGDYYRYPGIALPGQSISVQFWRTSEKITLRN